MSNKNIVPTKGGYVFLFGIKKEIHSDSGKLLSFEQFKDTFSKRYKDRVSDAYTLTGGILPKKKAKDKE